jgi:hypothetical protein
VAISLVEKFSQMLGKVGESFFEALEPIPAQGIFPRK